MNKKTVFITIFLSILFLGVLLEYSVQYISNPTFDLILPTKIESKKPVTLSLVGDIMLGRGLAISVNKNLEGNYFSIFENVPELKDTDITFGNLEGPITDSTDKQGSIYSFKFDAVVAQVLQSAGFDVVSFANNHVGDYGRGGFVDTLNILAQNNILFAGAGINNVDAESVRIINVRGKKIGFLGFSDVGPEWIVATENNPGILLASNKNFESIITREKAKVDFLVVSFHFGDEYKPATNRQKDLATRAVKSGADVIVGHHPHVIQEDTIIDGKPVLYSLGNFVFDQKNPPQTKVGMVAVITFNNDGTISLEKFSSDRDSFYRPSALRPFESKDAILE